MECQRLSFDQCHISGGLDGFEGFHDVHKLYTFLELDLRRNFFCELNLIFIVQITMYIWHDFISCSLRA